MDISIPKPPNFVQPYGCLRCGDTPPDDVDHQYVGGWINTVYLGYPPERRRAPHMPLSVCLDRGEDFWVICGDRRHDPNPDDCCVIGIPPNVHYEESFDRCPECVEVEGRRLTKFHREQEKKARAS